MEKILLVEDSPSLREALSQVLELEGHFVHQCEDAEKALKVLEKDDFSLVITDLKLPKMSGLDMLRSAYEQKHTPSLVMTAFGSIDIAVEAMKIGASDFITKPFELEKLCEIVTQLAEHRRIIDRNPIGERGKNRQIISASQPMEKLLHQAKKVAQLNSPVLLLGESGSGKELIARFIHANSPRGIHPFVAVNCATMPSELLESEFFGHEAGAFTGATTSRSGLFEVADKGTIFLDEIGTMPSQLQVKLLRTLQESEVRRLGSTKTQPINTRVVSATNCDLDAAIASGEFREDLYFRLGVVVLEIPPLRDRRVDIPLLTEFILNRFAEEQSIEAPKITDEAMAMLLNHSWPGNVRELENAIERAMIFGSNELGKDCFELDGGNLAEPVDYKSQTLLEIGQNAQQEAESQAMLSALEEACGNKSKAAKLLGVSYKTLLNKLKDYGLESK